jgi:hypothetical protein
VPSRPILARPPSKPSRWLSSSVSSLWDLLSRPMEMALGTRVQAAGNSSKSS